MPPPSEIPRLLESAAAGDRQAAAELLPLVYDELRRLAARFLEREPRGQTLQPTALVHEAYLRLVGDRDSATWKGRGHFFGAAAEAMRRILVEAARRKQSLKQGGGRARENLDLLDLASPQPREDLLALDEALTKLAGHDRAAADVVQLRYFAGLTLEETARSLAVSTRTASRLWTFARAWLRCEIEGPIDQPKNN